MQLLKFRFFSTQNLVLRIRHVDNKSQVKTNKAKAILSSGALQTVEWCHFPTLPILALLQGSLIEMRARPQENFKVGEAVRLRVQKASDDL